ncbi:MAG: YggS family pyridoxal phosphate-dependent enzyme [Mariniblastus sp.]|nr:YggS family pyridoxal phosphate-dependent enzyme [Mariniblastus sp.]
MIEKLKANLNSIHQRIEMAASKSGRTAAEIKLVGVTKYVDAETTQNLFEAGCADLGESRPQVLWDKSAALTGMPIRWHMIGHLQRNKVKRTVDCCELIHSVDSERLMLAIDQAGQALQKTAHVLIEINVSGETAKHGFNESEVEVILAKVESFKHIQVDGLMCMAGLRGDLNSARQEFAALKEIQMKFQSDVASNVNLKHLSMGMSGDFETAIEEGATLVRVGSLLFEGL